MKIEELFTRPASEEGAWMDVKLPDGKLSGNKIKLRGTDSDTFRQVSAWRSREDARILTLPKEEQAEALHQADIGFVARLTVEWDFDDEFTLDNVVNLYTNAPQVFKQANQFSGTPANFFAKR